MVAPTHTVTALQLNLRSSPNPKANNQIAVLPQGTPVEKISNSNVHEWWQVKVDFSGEELEGYVNSSFLGPTTHPFPSGSVIGGAFPRADLGKSSSSKRSSTGGRANSIGEAGAPGPAASHSHGKAAGILEII